MLPTRAVYAQWAIQAMIVGALATACEDEHPPVVSAPKESFSLCGDLGRQVAGLTFDPRGLSRLALAGDTHGTWMRPNKDDVWHYREWQWWKGHPWGDSCRPRYWTKAHFQIDRVERPRISIAWRMDGFDTDQEFLLPAAVDSEAPFFDLVVTIRNVSGADVEEYGQFFACYTPLNRDRSFWFWDISGELVLFADRGVTHLDGYVVHPAAYFLEGGAIPHCPRGNGKVVGRWGRPVLVSQASPAGWRSVICLEERHTAALAHGICGGAMDYILFPGPAATARKFAEASSFSVHIRHTMLKSSELPTRERLESLWTEFEQSHISVHERAQCR